MTELDYDANDSPHTVHPLYFGDLLALRHQKFNNHAKFYPSDLQDRQYVHWTDRQPFLLRHTVYLNPVTFWLYSILSDTLSWHFLLKALPEKLSIGFYDKGNVQYTTQQYKNRATDMVFKNVIANNLPTPIDALEVSSPNRQPCPA